VCSPVEAPCRSGPSSRPGRPAHTPMVVCGVPGSSESHAPDCQPSARAGRAARVPQAVTAWSGAGRVYAGGPQEARAGGPGVGRGGINGSGCRRDRPGFGCDAVYQTLRRIQYYRVLNIIILRKWRAGSASISGYECQPECCAAYDHWSICWPAGTQLRAGSARAFYETPREEPRAGQEGSSATGAAPSATPPPRAPRGLDPWAMCSRGVPT
jgi:hypothetical protein